MLGEAVNYNAYGDSEADVRIHPAALYRWLAHYDDPFEAIAQAPIVRELDALRRADLDRARAVAPRHRDEHSVRDRAARRALEPPRLGSVCE